MKTDGQCVRGRRGSFRLPRLAGNSPAIFSLLNLIAQLRLRTLLFLRFLCSCKFLESK